VPVNLQSKLLRVLEIGEMERVGSSKTKRVNVRIISATNANLGEEVANGRFREDLLFRLNTIEIHLPPLRDRKEDIPLLASNFLNVYAQRYRKRLAGFDQAAMQALMTNTWQGNVRELNHVIERAVLLAQDTQVRLPDLALRSGPAGPTKLEEMSLEEVEAFLIKKALARYDGNVSHAAHALGLSRSALYRRLQRYNL
jgi:DNA-binding NtrC family response regulator